MPINHWTEEELVLALALYFKLPFGRLNHGTPEVKELARLIGRTDNSVALRLVNFAACDPYILATGRHGMEAGRKVCQPIWDRYAENKEQLYRDAAEIEAHLQNRNIETAFSLTPQDFEGQERETVIRQRVGQSAFHSMIFHNYNNTCAITGINEPRLLIASHIIPWAERADTRLNPENGICLSALYDKAFDKGLITIRPEDYTVKISPELRDRLTKDVYAEHFGKVENKRIILPEEHSPAIEFLEYHVNRIFVS